MELNFLAILVAALSTMVIGAVWYNPKVFGTMWMNETGMTQEKAKNSNMMKIFGMSIFFALMIAFVLQFAVVHQFGPFGLIDGDITTAKPSYEAFMADYGHVHRTFTHGMTHGFMMGLFMALPVVGTNALFERKSWRYIFINSGYWIVCFMIMGGIICAWE
ncbi:MAG: hypothetical protein BM557_03595 [Flavobacterium sp. MedPE-SWcel]|uniref:DUF1761 domain-containing protein n=1 Tax=uncultured Flavobacterium sp. TaxID=165435 RepID=UPI00091E5882|nr:DUF1761 domain-containing protein [uncultured Flavobacterium sp.]OIQ21348.1 MAG: hypothetical protein BM557_03595 [Flavobacterium sp. MedPE-SWcel]